jgi:hypothetical protein
MWSEILKADPKKLKQALAERGYEIVDIGQKGGRHFKPTIKELSTGKTVRVPISGEVARDNASPRSIKNAVSQVIRSFAGRRRRGQGQFKLSENDNEEHWTDILKAPRLGTEDRERKKNFIKQGKIILNMPFRREGMPHDNEDIPDRQNAESLFDQMKKTGETEVFTYEDALTYMEQLQEGTAVEFSAEDFKAYGPHPSDWEFKVKVL